MKKLTSIGYSTSAFNTAMLILRLGVGILMMSHGYSKLVGFESIAPKFMNFMGIGSTVSLGLVVFAEFFCSIFVILGLFTRLAAIPIVIDMLVATVKAHNLDVFDTGEKSTLFLVAFIVILILGPGRISVDGAINK
jgi:putative oxidoreductase